MHFRRLAAFALAAGLVCASAAQQAQAGSRESVLAIVHQFVDGFNKGDTASALAACASPAMIIDDFAPHEWHGATACADWANAYNANADKNGISDGLVAMGNPWQVAVSGDSAYVVVPVTYTYKQHGKPMTESGSLFTVALRKLAAGWRITGWAWSQH